MNDVTQKTLEMLLKENESMRQDIAGMGDSMIRAMLALDARVDELEVALVSVAKRLPAAASAVRNDEQGKEL
jgi:hypothetical protein